MKVKPNVLVHVLERHLRWLEGLTWLPPDDQSSRARAADVTVWCLDFVELSPTTNLQAWLGRHPRRKLLADPVQAARTAAGRRAILELIKLTISELAASAAFLPQVNVSGLPGARLSQPPTEAQRSALRRENMRRKEAVEIHRRLVEKRAAELRGTSVGTT